MSLLWSCAALVSFALSVSGEHPTLLRSLLTSCRMRVAVVEAAADDFEALGVGAAEGLKALGVGAAEDFEALGDGAAEDFEALGDGAAAFAGWVGAAVGLGLQVPPDQW
ncbi:hypothetical protein AB0C96_25315 [Streptomyces sp. NPDC048506]|uniref:hypothetical protein n=1 Tax=Streptomyces sp. NPDC048506 TaxID=3155028 RepID=UPI0034341264